MQMLHHIWQNLLETLSWEALLHSDYSPDLAPSDYHLFALLAHALAKQRFSSCEDFKSGSMDYSRKRGKMFPGVVYKHFFENGKSE